MRSPEPGDLPVGDADWWLEAPDSSGVCQALKVRLVHRERTPYQRLAVLEHRLLGRILVLDDVVQTTQADEFIYHEMLVHVPLLGSTACTRSDGADVLIVGGGDGGTLREVLSHDWVRRVVMVEIDEAVVRACREHLRIHGDYDDPRVELVIGDGVAYVASDAARSRPFDVILVDSTDPGGPSEPLFGERFCRDALRCLKPGGALARQMGVPFYQPFLAPALAQMREVFGTVEIYRAAVPTYIGGDMAFLVSTTDGSSCRQPRREHVGRFYNPDVHRAAFAVPTFWTRPELAPPTAE